MAKIAAKRRGPRLHDTAAVRRELGRQYRRAALGEIDALELSRFATALRIMVQLIETDVLVARLAELEARVAR